jgi:hypothetical protein
MQYCREDHCAALHYGQAAPAAPTDPSQNRRDANSPDVIQRRYKGLVHNNDSKAFLGYRSNGSKTGETKDHPDASCGVTGRKLSVKNV